MIVAKAHYGNLKKLVAVCDKELLGKRFEEGERQLDLTGSYYDGEEVNEEVLVKILDGAYSASFVGKESVSFAKKHGIAEDVMAVEGIPHAQMFTVAE